MIIDFLKKAAERSGFVRDRFEERKIPTDLDDIVIVPFFGDYRSSFLMSSWFLNRFRQEQRPGKYFILASWPGQQGLYPYVDEYWSIREDAQLKKLYDAAICFNNPSDIATLALRSLNENFRDVADVRKVVDPYYQNGLNQNFWDKYKSLKKFLPHVPSSAILGKDFGRELATRAGYKIFIQPLQSVKTWHCGKVKNLIAPKLFWTELVNNFLENGFTPVVWQNYLTYDISSDFTDKCVFVNDKDLLRVMAAMRSTGCVLDVFSGLSKFAIAARCPYLAMVDRQIWSNLKEYEVDDLSSNNIPREYIFTFPTIISDGAKQSWVQELFPNIIKRLEKFLPELNRDDWPSTAETTEVVLYEKVRKNINKKIGTKLLKITRD